MEDPGWLIAGSDGEDMAYPSPTSAEQLSHEIDNDILRALGYDAPGKEHSYRFWRAWARAGLFRRPPAFESAQLYRARTARG